MNIKILEFKPFKIQEKSLDICTHYADLRCLARNDCQMATNKTWEKIKKTQTYMHTLKKFFFSLQTRKSEEKQTTSSFF